MHLSNRLVLLAPALLALTACGGPIHAPEAQGFEAFAAEVEKNRFGEWIVDGDTAILTEAQLREHYERNVAPKHADGDPELAEAESALQSFELFWTTLKWSSSDKTKLTYCVDADEFTPLQYEKVVRLTKESARAWELAANVRFAHDVSEDGSCPSTVSCALSLGLDQDVTFRIVRGDANGTKANATGPYVPCGRIRIDDGVLTKTDDAIRGTLTHELGHILGFRHEHLRNPAHKGKAGCGKQVYGLASKTHTSYDRHSIMHYLSCPGAYDAGVRELSARDQWGAAHVYGQPIMNQVAIRTHTGAIVGAPTAPELPIHASATNIGVKETFELLVLPNNQVSLRSFNRRFVGQNSSGVLKANKLMRAGQETFTAIAVGGRRFLLKAQGGKYLREFAGYVFANAPSTASATIFEIINLADHEIALRAYNDTWVTELSNGAATAGEDRIFRDERLYLVNLSVTPGAMTQVALRNRWGRYARVSGTAVHFDGEVIDASTTFGYHVMSDGKIRLQTSDGKWLWYDYYNLGALRSDGSQGGNYARFEVVDIAGDAVNLRTAKKFYWTAFIGGGGSVDATKVKAQGWQGFDMVELGGNQVALRTMTGQYVGIEHQFGQSETQTVQLPTLGAYHDWLGQAETFERYWVNGKVALRASNGKYVYAVSGGGSALVPASSSIASYAKFTVFTQ